MSGNNANVTLEDLLYIPEDEEKEAEQRAAAIAASPFGSHALSLTKQYERDIKNILSRARKIIQGFDVPPWSLKSDYVLPLAIESEYLTRRIRNLTIDVSKIPSKDYMLSHTASALDISVSLDSNGSVTITLPGLLPKRKTRGAKFIADPLFAVLNEFIINNPGLKRFGMCTICVTHIYNRDVPLKNRMCDFDNLELKEIIDVINVFLLTDDSGEWCSFYQTTALGDMDVTRISIMENHLFAKQISLPFIS